MSDSSIDETLAAPPCDDPRAPLGSPRAGGDELTPGELVGRLALLRTGDDRPRALALAHEARAGVEGQSAPERATRAALDEWLRSQGEEP